MQSNSCLGHSASFGCRWGWKETHLKRRPTWWHNGSQWMKSQLTAVSVAQQCLAMVSPVDVRDTKPYLVSQSVLWWLTCCWDGHFALCYQSLCYKGRLSSICWCHPQKCCHVKWSLVEAGDVRHLLFFACTGPLTLAGNHNLRNFVAIYALFGCTIFSHPLWWFDFSWQTALVSLAVVKYLCHSLVSLTRRCHSELRMWMIYNSAPWHKELLWEWKTKFIKKKTQKTLDLYGH